MESSKHAITKEEAVDILDRTIGFVQNCDNKTSILLAVFAGLFTIVFSTECPSIIQEITIESLKLNSVMHFIFFILGLLSVLFIMVGIITLIFVLIPKVEGKDIKGLEFEQKSKIFFGGIVMFESYDKYKDSLLHMTEEEYMNHIVSQIYINSIICSKKYRKYTIGMRCSLVGFALFFICLTFGLFI
ncbi:hypothetical protein AOC36_09880 [Erysipelothrix larvae]|uniref:Pycsar effector protein domain-containing protein n=2 Tax=Erysipelothrix larvae TaxID=1514105 RepID=A0A109UHH1_9FIRM|nr:hypothetical protein AOC36_09880 [Erysipelothrix larvae]